MKYERGEKNVFQENVKIAKPKRGDVLAVLCTGAYNYSMASNYNRIPRPPIVMVNNGIDRVAVKRETFEDIIRNENYRLISVMNIHVKILNRKVVN